MTDLDSPRRNNDCYFYYYSTCTKGDSCTFRHEPSALGCETMCSFWKEGKCLNVHCNYRHMELRKNRKAIQCYWETQPGGCLKPHCPFLHQNVRQSMTNYDDNTTTTNVNNTNNTENSESTEDGEVSPSSTQNEIGGQSTERNFRKQVDTLVVNFEEESDTESLPKNSTIIPKVKKLKVKTLEEIKLDRIQEESAAYFAYSLDHPDNDPVEDLRRNLTRKRKGVEQENSRHMSKRIRLDTASPKLNNHLVYSNPTKGIFFKNNINAQQNSHSEFQKVIDPSKIQTMEKDNRKNKLLGIKNKGISKKSQKTTKELASIKIKTLEEIRAEKNKINAEKGIQVTSTEEISSTIKENEDEIKLTESQTMKVPPQKKRIKLIRLSSTELQELFNGTKNHPKEITIQTKHSGKYSEQKPIQSTLVLSTKDTENNFSTQTDSGKSILESVDQNLTSENEDISVQSTRYEEEMLLIDDLDYEDDDGLMREINSILSN